MDLVLTKTHNNITTNTFFKDTNRNGYVPIQSCHHLKWLTAIPKGQYMRIRRNCNSIEDYNTQSAILTNRFSEKGYSSRALNKCQKQVLSMNRETLLSKSKKVSFRADLDFITGFHRQYREVEKYLKSTGLSFKESFTKPDQNLYTRGPQELETKLHPTFRTPPKTIST